MFDIGFFEILLVGVVALLVVGPERLPDAVRTTARWWGNIKRTLHNARDELEREIGADEIRRDLHNERVMRELEESRREMEQAARELDTRAEHEAPKHEAPKKPDIGKGGQEPSESAPQPAPSSAEDYLPEEDEDLQDPEYPEHWHDHGDPDLNPHHPDHYEGEEQAAEEPQKGDPESGDGALGDRESGVKEPREDKGPQGNRKQS